MTTRERILAGILVTVILAAVGGFFGYKLFWQKRQDQLKSLARLHKEFDEKIARRDAIIADLPKLGRYRQLSLPADTDVARREYEKYLNDLMRHSGFNPGSQVTPRPADSKTSPAIPGKGPIYTKLTFNVQAYATLANVVRMLREFYHTGLLHQIKSLDLQRQLTTASQTRGDELDVKMTIEALVVSGADHRTWLVPNIDPRLLGIDTVTALKGGPTGLGLAFWAAGPAGPLGPGLLASSSRHYEDIAVKNMFHGRAPRPVREVSRPEGTPSLLAPRYVKLTEIFRNDRGRIQGVLFDQANNRPMRLRPALGYNTFPFVRDGAGRAIVIGTVEKVEDRDLVFRVSLVTEEGGRQPAEGAEGFFAPSPDQLKALKEDNVIGAKEENLVVRVDPAYWDSLVEQKIIRTSNREPSRFRIELERTSERPGDDVESRIELLRGVILQNDDDDVLLLLEDRYYNVHMGESLEESLRRPLPADKVKELRASLDGGS